MRAHHIVNVSGGKDSAACYLLALERRERRGVPFRAVMADTGHEHLLTTEWVRLLPRRTGGPVVEIVKADFSRHMARKRAFILRKWPEHGVPQDRVERAAALMQPTGIPFLDLCLWKGRFPSKQRRFCTEELKAIPVDETVIEPALAVAPVVKWQGERREESQARANLPMFQTVRWPAPAKRMTIYRPLIRWTADDVFALHRKHGLQPNPLYRHGMGRVGCFPCIMAGKEELRAIGARFPDAVEKLVEWEALVAEASKRGAATFFGPDKTPEGAAMAAAGVTGSADGEQYPGAREVFEWSKTTRGGRQFNLLAHGDDGLACSSQYGLCE